MQEKIIILDFGSQTTQLIGRRLRELNDSENVLFKGVRENSQVWMSHGDTITAIPDNFKTIASTDKVAIAAYQVTGEKMWGVQFHPEVFHSEDGTQMLRNFVVDVCGCSQSWRAAMPWKR